MVDTNLSYSLTNNDNNNYSRKYTYVSSRLLKSLNYPDFRKALSWDSISKLYNKKYLASTKPVFQEKSKTFPYLMDIGYNPFVGCSNIHFESHSPMFNVIDGVLYGENGTKLICYPAWKAIGEINLPDNAIVLERGAFSGCNQMTKINLHNVNIISFVTSHCEQFTMDRCPQRCAFFDVFEEK